MPDIASPIPNKNPTVKDTGISSLSALVTPLIAYIMTAVIKIRIQAKINEPPTMGHASSKLSPKDCVLSKNGT
jgi:hypothetical protein